MVPTMADMSELGPTPYCKCGSDSMERDWETCPDAKKSTRLTVNDCYTPEI